MELLYSYSFEVKKKQLPQMNCEYSKSQKSQSLTEKGNEDVLSFNNWQKAV